MTFCIKFIWNLQSLLPRPRSQALMMTFDTFTIFIYIMKMKYFIRWRFFYCLPTRFPLSPAWFCLTIPSILLFLLCLGLISLQLTHLWYSCKIYGGSYTHAWDYVLLLQDALLGPEIKKMRDDDKHFGSFLQKGVCILCIRDEFNFSISYENNFHFFAQLKPKSPFLQSLMVFDICP